MTRYLVDTTFLIDYLRDDPDAVARFERFFAEGDDVLVNEVVACEVSFGVPGEQAALLDALLRPTEFVQPGPAGAINAGGWRADARRSGRVLSLADALIAAAADAADAVVLTRNVRDFGLTPVRVESY